MNTSQSNTGLPATDLDQADAVSDLTAETNPDRIQRRASDPAESVWVGASAGTGKTKVLTDRVLRLMLPGPHSQTGTVPGRILCITFTKAAAAEMSIRISRELGEWATACQTDLREKLEKLTGHVVDDDLLGQARRLFAKVVDTPGGMKIMTIHAFCQSVLRRFPLEAGLPPHFDVMDDLSAREFLRSAQEHTMEAARCHPDGQLGQAMARLATIITDPEKFADLMGQITAERSRLKRLIHMRDAHDPHRGVDQLVADVYGAVGADPGQSVDDIRHAACAEGAFDRDALRRAADALSGGTDKCDKPKSQQIQAWLAATPDERSNMYDDYVGVFFKKTGEPFAGSRMATKKPCEAMPDLLDIMYAEAERLIRVRERINAQNVAENTAALLRVGADILEHYENRKKAAALLDYDDLIFTTLDLLEQGEGIAEWVLYKLDGGIDHLLIDEAQDTNPEQWDIIRRLSDAFWEGLGARGDLTRTVFAVGDEKQSIYSFQRADPAKFVAMRDYYAQRLLDMGAQLQRVPMQVSFRSTSAVLELVDAVFSDPEIARGVVFDDSGVHHKAWRAGQAGRVELWPLVHPPDNTVALPWSPPVQAESGLSASARLARAIAERIQSWIKDGTLLQSKNRPIRPRDVLILVRSRSGGFVEQMVRELKSAGIPVSGVDRMVLTEQLPVMDLLVLADFLLLNRDDLSLATILKSPLIGFDDDDLMTLAFDRKAGLWGSLLDKSGTDPRYERAAAYLKHLADRVTIERPYEFFAGVLSAPCPADPRSGRHAMLARLGTDAQDPLDELLNKALEFEASHPPSMQGFTAWLRAGSSQIKRELEQGESDHVRIMTVHGSKGLQAPIVFLPDTTGQPKGHSSNRPTLLWPMTGSDVPLWAQRLDEADPVYRARREQAENRRAEEDRRLLYVALTRAEDRLYVCGHVGQKSAPEGCWYNLVERGMAMLGERAVETDFTMNGQPVLDREGNVQTALVYDVAQTAEPEQQKHRGWQPPVAGTLPDWVYTLPGDEPVPAVPLTPSKPASREQAVFSPLRRDDSDIRWQRGVIVHQLLQLLPDLPPDSRAQACRAFLARPGHNLPSAKQEAIAKETMNVLQHPDFATIFGPGSLAEVPVSGLVGGFESDKYTLSGQIDRLLVTDDEILIVDYKTNRPPPRNEKDVCSAYLKQMAAYRAVISGIWPGRHVRCALLWTDGPFLMPLSDDVLEPYRP